MPTFRKGLEAIEEATNSKGGSKFQPFVPQIKWSGDKEAKYVLVLTPISECTTCDLHEWIEVGKGQKANGDEYKKFEQFIARTDAGIGEDYDDIEQRLGKLPRRRTLGVAVELEPVMETIKGRQRPKGFIVKTETFKRDGDDVEAPVVGILLQASKNFFGWLGSYDNTQAPITETPMQVIRRGTDQDTSYDFMPFPDLKVDFTPLFDGLGEIGYLRDDAEDLAKELGNYEDDFDAASYIGTALLDKRVSELADGDRYKELIDGIAELPPSKFDRKPPTGKPRAARPERPSPRKAESSDDGDSAKGKRFADLRASLEG